VVKTRAKMDHHLLRTLRLFGGSVGGGSSGSSSSVRTVIMPHYVVLVLLGLLCSLHLSYGFNIDVPSALMHRGPSGSMFGFSIAQHKDSNISWYEFCMRASFYDRF